MYYWAMIILTWIDRTPTKFPIYEILVSLCKAYVALLAQNATELRNMKFFFRVFITIFLNTLTNQLWLEIGTRPIMELLSYIYKKYERGSCQWRPLLRYRHFKSSSVQHALNNSMQKIELHIQLTSEIGDWLAAYSSYVNDRRKIIPRLIEIHQICTRPRTLGVLITSFTWQAVKFLRANWCESSFQIVRKFSISHVQCFHPLRLIPFFF